MQRSTARACSSSAVGRQRADVQVVQRGDGARLTFESLPPLRVAGEIWRQHLERNGAIEPRIARPVDLAHSPRASERDDLVRAEASAGRQGHVGLSRAADRVCQNLDAHGRRAARGVPAQVASGVRLATLFKGRLSPEKLGGACRVFGEARAGFSAPTANNHERSSGLVTAYRLTIRDEIIDLLSTQAAAPRWRQRRATAALPSAMTVLRSVTSAVFFDDVMSGGGGFRLDTFWPSPRASSPCMQHTKMFIPFVF